MYQFPKPSPVATIYDSNGGANSGSLPPTPQILWFNSPTIGDTLYSEKDVACMHERILDLEAVLSLYKPDHILFKSPERRAEISKLTTQLVDAITPREV